MTKCNCVKYSESAEEEMKILKDEKDLDEWEKGNIFKRLHEWKHAGQVACGSSGKSDFARLLFGRNDYI